MFHFIFQKLFLEFMDILDDGLIFDFKTEKHVSWMYSAFGFLVFIGISIALGSENIFAVLPVLFFGFVIFTIRKRVLLEGNARYYQLYTSILGFKTGKKKYFDTVEYLYITRRKMGQNMSFVSVQNLATFKEYLGSIRFSENEKIILLVRENRESIYKGLENLSDVFQTKIIDYTEYDD